MTATLTAGLGSHPEYLNVLSSTSGIVELLNLNDSD